MRPRCEEETITYNKDIQITSIGPDITLSTPGTMPLVSTRSEIDIKLSTGTPNLYDAVNITLMNNLWIFFDVAIVMLFVVMIFVREWKDRNDNNH